MFSYNELKSEVMDIEEESALEEFRERFRSSNHSLAELKSSSSKHDFYVAMHCLL